MMKKRLLALLLCLVMLVGLVPMALAEEIPAEVNPDGAGDSITVHFDLHGGTGTETKTAETASNGKPIVGAVTAPTRDNFTFAGWYVDAAYTSGEWDVENYAIEPAPADGQFYLHAKWTADSYTIKYAANGGTGTMADTVTTEEYTCLRKNTFTCTGKDFAGWTLGSDTFVDRAAVSVDKLAAADTDSDKIVTATAQWTDKQPTTPTTSKYTITYKLDESNKKTAETDTNGKLKIAGWPSSTDGWTVPTGKQFAGKWMAGTNVYTVGETVTFTRDTTLEPVLIDKPLTAAGKSTVTYYCGYCYKTESETFSKYLSQSPKLFTSITVDPNGGSFSYKKTGIASGDELSAESLKLEPNEKIDATGKTILFLNGNVALYGGSRTGYTFAGWYFDSKTSTFTAQWIANRSTYCDIYYFDYDDGKYEYAEFYYGTSIVIDPNGGTAKLNSIPFSVDQYFEITRDYTLSDATRTGYTFYGWDLTKVGNAYYFTAKWTRSSTVPYMLNGEDHYAYIKGYPNGTFKPTANITRAEVSVIFYRLLTDSTRKAYSTSYNTFKDVPANAWYATAVSTMAKLGIVNGSGGYFRPNDYITRAEIAAMIARCDGGYYTGSYTGFSDVYGHWASSYIGRAYELGWINGYGSTYAPDQYVTRAETVAIVNRVLNRAPQYNSDLAKYMITFSDVSTAKWYYLDVQEAANSHDYTRKANGYETWTKIIADPSWL